MENKQKVWMKGDEKRGKEVIKTLEAFGGINTYCLDGNLPNQIYFITHKSNIFPTEEDSELAEFAKEYYQEKTLPEKWKEGDIIISKDMQTYCVVASTITSDSDAAVTLSVDRKGDYDYYEDMEDGVDYIEKDKYRKATEDEIVVFHELLQHNHKDWDAKENKLVDWHWMPKNKELYYYVQSTGEVRQTLYYDKVTEDVERVKFGNCFKTKYEAEVKASEIKDIFSKN